MFNPKVVTGSLLIILLLVGLLAILPNTQVVSSNSLRYDANQVYQKVALSNNIPSDKELTRTIDLFFPIQDETLKSLTTIYKDKTLTFTTDPQPIDVVAIDESLILHMKNDKLLVKQVNGIYIMYSGLSIDSTFKVGDTIKAGVNLGTASKSFSIKAPLVEDDENIPSNVDRISLGDLDKVEPINLVLEDNKFTPPALTTKLANHLRNSTADAWNKPASSKQ